MRKMLVSLGIVAALLGAGACTQAEPVVVSGTITDKYIEDFTEFQLVMKEANGTVHHFEVTGEEWRAAVVGMPYSNQQVAEVED